jgi:branched-chain amino acid transport system permease protein
MDKKDYGIRALLPWLLALGLVWLVHFFVADDIDPYVFSIIMYAGINIVLAISLNLVNGFTGQFSIGHAGFMSVGAYVSAFASFTLKAKYPQIFDYYSSENAVFVACLFAGGLGSAIVGYLVGLPSLRLKGDYLAIVTLGFGEIIRVVLLNIEAVGGARGMPGIPPLSNFGWVYTLALLTAFTIWRLVNSAQGRGFLCVREDEIAADAMGIDTTKVKVRAFVIAAFFAGIGGGLFAHQLAYINPQIFDFNRSFEIVIMVVLGGMGSISGSVVAAVLLTVLKEALRPLQEYTHIDFRMVIYSLMLIVLMLTRPQGLFGTAEIRDFLRFGRRKAAKNLNHQEAKA